MSQDLDRQILAYEKRHNMTSEELRHRVSTGIESETWEICLWLLLLNRRDRHNQAINKNRLI